MSVDELTQRAKDPATRRLTLIHSSMFILDSSLVGIAFAAGWTPCVGPILASILFHASSTNSILSGIALLAVYSLGLALPFFLVSLELETFLERYQKLRRHFRLISIISGISLIGVGILLMTNYFLTLTAVFNRWFPFLSKFNI